MEQRQSGLLSEDVWMRMPRDYADHPLSRRLVTLKDEETLKDVAVTFGASGRVQRMSGFLLSLLSPVWRARLCGEFSHGRERRLELDEDEAEAVMLIVELGCGGGEGRMVRGLDKLLEVGCVADRYQVDEVREAVEDELVRHLTVETCLELHGVSEKNGLRGVEKACRKMALERFEALTRTEGFTGMGEEMLRSLLEDDGLMCEREEAVFEGVLRWMRWGGGREVRGEGLLETIRFPVMKGDYLMTSARNALVGSERLERLVSEALVLKGLPAEERSNHVKYLCGKALRDRLERGVRWGDYCEGQRDARRLPLSSDFIVCLADCGDWVCGGHAGGTITVWNKASIEMERTLAGHVGAVKALAVCEGWLVSGSEEKQIRVWDVSGGQCVRTLEGHTSWVCALSVCETMLLSGSYDCTVGVWRVGGAPSTWRCERTLSAQKDRCQCVVWWGSKAVSGHASGAIRVWDPSTGGCVRTLQGHTNSVTALVAREGRLMSASGDRSVREWCPESGACVKVVEAYPAESPQFIRSLVLSGGTLVGGSFSFSLSCECTVFVWGLDTWAEERRLKQPSGQPVHTLLAIEGEVWGGVGAQLVVWGREG